MIITKMSAYIMPDSWKCLKTCPNRSRPQNPLVPEQKDNKQFLVSSSIGSVNKMNRKFHGLSGSGECNHLCMLIRNSITYKDKICPAFHYSKYTIHTYYI